MKKIAVLRLFGFCLLLLAPASLATADKDQEACCDFSSNKKPLWQAVLELSPKPSGDCVWSNAGGDMAYTDARHIVVGSFTQCLHATPHETRVEKRALLLQVDAANGNLLNRADWNNVPSPRNRIDNNFQILATHDGRFLVRAGAVLKLLGPDFKEIRSRLLVQSDSSDWDYWFVRVAPDGRQGFFKRGKQSGVSEDHWFSADTLEDEQVDKAPPEEDRLSNPIITNSRVYFHGREPKGLYVRERGQESFRVLCSKCTGVPVTIFPDGLLFVASLPKASFMLVSPEGTVVHRASYGTGADTSFHVSVASISPRFAFRYGHLERGLFSWSSAETAVVFDTKRMKDIYQLKYEPEAVHIAGGEGWTRTSIALSLDGTRLTVLSLAVLKAFEISK
jgi:hypothetical protein